MESSVASPMNESNLTGSFSSGLEKELDDLVMSDESESDYEPFYGITDGQVLTFGIGWTGNSNDPNQRQLQRVFVDKSDRKKSDFKKSDFVQFLKKIGCEDSYAARSVQFSNCCFAWLTEDEAAKLKGVEGVLNVLSCSCMVILH